MPTWRPIRLVVLALAISPSSVAAAADCRRVVQSIGCVDGNPSCDLDATCDGRCVAAVCLTGPGRVPRMSFCPGNLAWDTLVSHRIGRHRIENTIGVCPPVRRFVACRRNPRPDCPRPRRQTCVVGLNGAPAMARRCRVRAIRHLTRLGGPGWTDISVRLFDVPDQPVGVPAFVSVFLPFIAAEGLFTANDPESPILVGANLSGTHVPPGSVNSARLHLTSISQEPTIWLDELHGTLDLDVGGNFSEPDRLLLQLEF